MSAVATPTLLFCGRQHAWSPVERQEQMPQQLLPSALLAVFEDSVHLVAMEQALAVSAVPGDLLG